MIKLITFENCGPFKGKHSITLGPGAYAIVAQHEEDSRKSNGVGKSFILEMIQFALTGVLSKSREGNIDRWITHGEPKGVVTMTFEDGAYVERSKIRGQSAQIRFKTPEMQGEAAQDEAAAAVLNYLMLEKEDLPNAAYFEQRKMARLVDPDQTAPGDRLAIVSGWFGLGLAERAEEAAGERASEHEKELTKLVVRRDAARAQLAGDESEPDLHVLDKIVEDCGAVMRALDEEKARFKKVREAHIVIDAQKARIESGAKLREAIGENGELVAARAKDADEELEKLSNAVTVCSNDVRQRRKTALGQFNGACPVAPITCPVKDKINSDREVSERGLREATAAKTKADDAFSKANEKYTPVLERARAYARMAETLKEIKEATQKAAPAVKLAKEYLVKMDNFTSLDEYEQAYDDRRRVASIAMQDALVKSGIAKNEVRTRANARAEIATLEKDITKKHTIVSRHLKLRVIYRLAQRRVAERNLAFVEDEANFQLADADIDLSVKARWEREADGPAKTCDDCGAAFPTSRKVKNCERCGALRGSHTVQKLDFVLSDRSGALNDLGGISMQLAAGSWLLGARHSPWSTALMDEPFAQCDAFNRRMLATQLLKLLNRGVFRQAIVISHSPETIDVWPNKITIIKHKDGTRSINQ